MEVVGRVVAFVLGLIASAIALAVDVLYSAVHRISGVLGDTGLDRTHGFIGFLLVLVGVVGSVLALFAPLPAAVLLLVAGIGMFFVVKGYALFSILFFVLAAALSLAARPARRVPPDRIPR
jgi:hypothetical protein